MTTSGASNRMALCAPADWTERHVVRRETGGRLRLTRVDR